MLLGWFKGYLDKQEEKYRKGRIDINEALLGSKVYKELSSKVDMLTATMQLQDKDVNELKLLLGLLNISVKELLSALEEHLNTTKELVKVI